MKRLSRAFSCWESFVEQSGGFVAAIAGLGFVCTLGVLPFEQAAPVLMAAVAVTGGLSSLCFSFATPDAGEQDRQAGRYAGEKLLHGSLLAVQAILVKFAGTQALRSSLVANTHWLREVVTAVLAITAAGLGAFAMYACYYGIERINAVLWRRYHERRAGMLAGSLGPGSESSPAPNPQGGANGRQPSRSDCIPARAVAASRRSP